ncbi:hypothetical protein A2645_01225 [Candidatus Nomurabacteria bacterium RIFCSPHIGHO2_01_FULL_39_9]|uniref:VanZ-like domain-containing protein n=1 Tax=Candidatus Nomurabacteria bacterium RIFCSPHIGHO2_01_FULL_39_9 TaxID=1801735 RepID=A0A1F6UWF5_9BACT|nr:MAG: hypothetical protein A2645_01225 [Candidatus Nomurabacteria bacterium RIFCSPHIGHO2_01_FULL_39_9]
MNKISKLIVWLIWSVFFINLAAFYFSWYWTMPWFDNFMHFLGGFWIVLTLSWLREKYLFKYFNNTAIFILSGLVIVGLSWEVFEFLIGATSDWLANLPDTVSDLIFDMLGGLAAYLYLFRSNRITK